MDKIINLLAYFKRYPYYAVIGIFGFIINIALTIFLTEVLGVWYLLSFITMTLLTWTGLFFANSYLTFSDGNRSGIFRRYLAFMGSYILLGSLNFLLLFLSTSIVGIPYTISIVVFSCVFSLITFSLNKDLIYK